MTRKSSPAGDEPDRSKHGTHRPKTEEERLIDQAIGKRIREVRQKHAGANTDLRSFAAPLGVTATAVYQWENGSGISHYKLRRISDEYGISVEWLLGLSDRPQRSFENEMKRLKRARRVKEEGYRLFDIWFSSWKADNLLQQQKDRRKKQNS